MIMELIFYNKTNINLHRGTNNYTLGEQIHIHRGTKI
jgi:hypothetical protein